MATRGNPDGTLTFGGEMQVPPGTREPSDYRKPPGIRVGLLYELRRHGDVQSQGFLVVEVESLEDLHAKLRANAHRGPPHNADPLGLWRHHYQGDDKMMRVDRERWDYEIFVTQVIINP